jgi:hypothetical protein
MDMGTTNIRKEGIQQASIKNMALALMPYWTMRSVMSRILAIKKTRVNKSRLRTKGGIISTKTYRFMMLNTFM